MANCFDSLGKTPYGEGYVKAVWEELEMSVGYLTSARHLLFKCLIEEDYPLVFNAILKQSDSCSLLSFLQNITTSHL